VYRNFLRRFQKSLHKCSSDIEELRITDTIGSVTYLANDVFSLKSLKKLKALDINSSKFKGTQILLGELPMLQEASFENVDQLFLSQGCKVKNLALTVLDLESLKLHLPRDSSLKALSFKFKNDSLKNGINKIITLIYDKISCIRSIKLSFSGCKDLPDCPLVLQSLDNLETIILEIYNYQDLFPVLYFKDLPQLRELIIKRYAPLSGEMKLNLYGLPSLSQVLIDNETNRKLSSMQVTINKTTIQTAIFIQTLARL